MTQNVANGTSCDDGDAQNVANGTSCDDGNPASLGDSCQSGICAGTPTDCSSKRQNGNSCKDTRVNHRGGRGRRK